MLLDIITYNAGWFISVAIIGILSGFMWKWKPIVATILLILFASYLVYSIAWLAVTPVELGGGLYTDKPWYYFIGAGCGGLVWSTVFEIGKDIYAYTVIE